MTKIVCIIIAAFVLVCLSCGDTTGPADTTWTVSGTLTKLDLEDGIMGYAMLITMEDDTTYNLIYSDESPFDAGMASYSMSSVAAGTYYFVAVIDVNGNWDMINGPDEGDLTSNFHEEIINQNTVINVPDDGWELWSGGEGNICVSGGLNKSGVADGISGYACLADSSFNIQFMSMPASFYEGSAHYEIYDVEEDTYQFGAFIDMNGNADPDEPLPDTGDWFSDPYLVWIDDDTEIDVNEADWSLYI